MRRTTPPVPVEAEVEPVPPKFVVRGPLRLMVMIPELVMVGFVTVRKEFPDSTVTDVTVPDVAGACHEAVVPLELKTVPLAPMVDNPVPPLAMPRVPDMIETFGVTHEALAVPTPVFDMVRTWPRAPTLVG